MPETTPASLHAQLTAERERIDSELRALGVDRGSYDEGFADSGQVTAERGEVDALVGSLIVAIILHEISHGVVAYGFGDDTAKRAGRLTLNPIPHVDPFGSIVLPAMGALAGLLIIGYAKPVPLNPNRMRNPRRYMLFVSLAGPASNMLLMIGAALATRWLLHGGRSLATSIDNSGNNLLLNI